MRKNRIRLTESQLHSIIKKSVKSFINEGGHLTWKDDDGRMHTNSQDNWYGIEGATFVSHGEWSDGEIYFDYEGEQYVINANDAEEWLWTDFKEYCEENNLNPDEHSDDEIWYNFARNEGYDVLLNLGPYNESYEMNESKKRKVRLTESQLHRVIKESVKQMLSGLDWKTYQNAAKKSHLKALDNDDMSDDEYHNEMGRRSRFRHAAEDAFNRDYGTNDTKLHSDMHGSTKPAAGGGYFPFHDDSYIKMKKGSDTYGTYSPYGYNKDFEWSYEYDNSKYRPEWDRAKQELKHYQNGDYDYDDEKGWHLKDNMDEAIRRAIRKALS